MGTLGQLEQLKSCDDPSFDKLYAIYAASIANREQKSKAWICEMVRAPEYRFWLMKEDDHARAFSIVFLPPASPFALLEYMAVAPSQRNHGKGSELFRQTMMRTVDEGGRSLPVLLEVDSDREDCGDRPLRARRQQFYRRLGCLRLSGLHYILPLSGEGPVPDMDLMVYAAEPVQTVPKADVERWLTTIYRDVYHCPVDDPRIARMLREVPDPVSAD